jgi:hypothetical protein
VLVARGFDGGRVRARVNGLPSCQGRVKDILSTRMRNIILVSNPPMF